jgi:hypothetical protein
MGIGSQEMAYVMPAVENINGQAITLANKHKAVKSAADFKGFKFGVPFDYSMHNFLLRYVVAEAGLDPDRDIQIRAVPPPEMVANLRAGNLDGYLRPDPFNHAPCTRTRGDLCCQRSGQGIPAAPSRRAGTSPRARPTPSALCSGPSWTRRSSRTRRRTARRSPPPSRPATTSTSPSKSWRLCSRDSTTMAWASG